ncbi:hypothetical protein KKH27_10080, partial [bacterium]|nr:hypothetical protein [bacterium]
MRSLLFTLKYSVKPMPMKSFPVMCRIRTGVACAVLCTLVLLFHSPVFAVVGVETTAVDSVDWSRITWDVKPYAIDKTDGGGATHVCQTDATLFQFDDDGNRSKYVANAQWRVNIFHDSFSLHIAIYPAGCEERPSHKLEIGARVTLYGGEFEDGTRSKTCVIAFNPNDRTRLECVYRIKPNTDIASQFSSAIYDAYTQEKERYLAAAMIRYPRPSPVMYSVPRWGWAGAGIRHLGREGEVAHFYVLTGSIPFSARTVISRWFAGAEVLEGYYFMDLDYSYTLASNPSEPTTFRNHLLSWVPLWVGYNALASKSLTVDFIVKFHPCAAYQFVRKKETSSGSGEHVSKNIFRSVFETSIESSLWLRNVKTASTAEHRKQWNIRLSLSYFRQLGSDEELVGRDQRTWPKLDGLSIGISLNGDLLRSRIYFSPRKEKEWQRLVAAEAERIERAESRPCEVVFSKGPTLDESYGLLQNGILDALERVTLPFEVTNNGPGPAFGPSLVVSITPSSIQVKNPSFASERLESGEKRSGKVDIEIPKDIEDDDAVVSFQITEARGYHSAEKKLTIRAAKLIPCELKLVDFKWSDGETGTARGNGDGIVQNGETIECQAFIRNDGKGPATLCNATLRSSDSQVLLDRSLSE